MAGLGAAGLDRPQLPFGPAGPLLALEEKNAKIGVTCLHFGWMLREWIQQTLSTEPFGLGISGREGGSGAYLPPVTYFPVTKSFHLGSPHPTSFKLVFFFFNPNSFSLE